MQYLKSCLHCWATHLLSQLLVPMVVESVEKLLVGVLAMQDNVVVEEWVVDDGD